MEFDSDDIIFLAILTNIVTKLPYHILSDNPISNVSSFVARCNIQYAAKYIKHQKRKMERI